MKSSIHFFIAAVIAVTTSVQAADQQIITILDSAKENIDQLTEVEKLKLDELGRRISVHQHKVEAFTKFSEDNFVLETSGKDVAWGTGIGAFAGLLAPVGGAKGSSAVGKRASINMLIFAVAGAYFWPKIMTSKYQKALEDMSGEELSQEAERLKIEEQQLMLEVQSFTHSVATK